MPTPRTSGTALPLYLQISEALTREIAAGRLADGERLAPERQLAQTYGTTVRTLRKALSELEKQGMLERIQGSGNYIRTTQTLPSVYSMFRLELPNGGGLPTADILSVTECDKPADLPQFGTSAQGTRIRRLRYLDSTIIAVEEIWLDAGAGRVDVAQLSDSLYRYYRLQLGFWISRAEDRVSLAPVPDWAPPQFTKPPGTTVGYIERLSWAQDLAPVEFSRTWFDTEKALYVQRLT
ncbi:GntR family transcriptional regulator [Phaeobacter inhibens]|uniref:GntR family transcriptional regulator n=1 Tax=Phaeobacter inhibens TaxID=221822 RepID=UPI000C9B9F33|nr:GntR family transcriptional regulator [Phaeobacter inhibens]AUQ53988.1 transcriptional regulator, GntR family [Phaeobacter inhibens]AUQ78004.1 transcriptional regulator, GntR family [Phaeobacter inhibens]AUR15163.1 transcriptional regulator, GntR family [Phaeobacter inhibens]UWR89819.1 GntR family transcriptional regulator [Phaeobacter inhibens]